MYGSYEVDEPVEFFMRNDRATDPDVRRDPTKDVHNPREVVAQSPTWSGQYVARVSHGDTYGYAEGAPFRFTGEDTNDCIAAIIAAGRLPGSVRNLDLDAVTTGYSSDEVTVKTLTYEIPCYRPDCGRMWHVTVTFVFLRVYEGT